MTSLRVLLWKRSHPFIWHRFTWPVAGQGYLDRLQSLPSPALSSAVCLRRSTSPWRTCLTQHQVFPTIAGIKHNHVRGGRKEGIKRRAAGKTQSVWLLSPPRFVPNVGAGDQAPTRKLISYELTGFFFAKSIQTVLPSGLIVLTPGCLHTVIIWSNLHHIA